SEALTVSKNSVSVSTALSSPGPFAIGAPVSDQASLAGETGTAGGSITYGVYSDSSCSTLAANVTPAGNTVVGGVAPASSAYTTTQAGVFYFRATYSGDQNNAGPVSSPCSSESFVVKGVTTQLSNPGPVSVGASVTDQAALNAATATAGGTISYGVF